MRTEAQRPELSDRLGMNANVSCHANVVFPSALPSPLGRGRNNHRARTHTTAFCRWHVAWLGQREGGDRRRDSKVTWTPCS